MFELIQMLYLSSKGFLSKVFTKQAWKRRKKGISVILPTQNMELLVEMSVKSMLDFADEIVIVDNGSTDNTIKIATKLAKQYEKVRFFNRPDIQTLFANRDCALNHSRFSWVCRFDADYIFYEKKAIELRKKILAVKQSWWPKAIQFLDTFSIGGDFHHYLKGPILYNRKNPSLRVYQYFPGMKFIRLGKSEGVTSSFLFKKISFKGIFWCNCNIKSKRDHFLRSERHHWRKVGDYKRFPTLISFVQKKHGADIDALAETYFDKHIKPRMKPYSEKKFLPYPKLLKEYLSVAHKV